MHDAPKRLSAFPVAIAGAGPVGKVLSLQLARYGISSCLVDPGNGVGPGARARITNARSMEHLRRLGIADEVRRQAVLPADHPMRSVYATRMGGFLLHAFDQTYGWTPVPDARFPEPSQHIPQDRLESALLAAVQTEPLIQTRFGCELVDFNAGESGVEAVCRDEAGVEFPLDCRFLIGCDGARSKVRDLLGTTLQGDSDVVTSIGVEFRSRPLRTLVEQGTLGKATQYWLVNPDAPVLISTVDGDSLWSLQYISRGAHDSAADAAARVRVLLEAAAGRSLDFEVAAVTRWAAHRLIANSYRQGRVFIIGDAAHLHPPLGGYGMNTGIGDAVNLAWKLAADIQGWAGPQLLESYEQERRPVHERVIQEAVDSASTLPESLFTSPQIEDDTPAGARLRSELGAEIAQTKARQHYALGVIFGDDYNTSSIVVPDGSSPLPSQTIDFEQRANPGARAPHAWLADGRSLYDALGPWYTVLCLSDDARADAALLAQGLGSQGVPNDTVVFDDKGLENLYRARLALVRPDGHIAWRGDAASEGDSIGAVVRGASAPTKRVA